MHDAKLIHVYSFDSKLHTGLSEYQLLLGANQLNSQYQEPFLSTKKQFSTYSI